MADYISQGVFHPSFPKHLISNEDRRIIEAFGINIKPDDDSQILLFAADWCNRGIIVTEDSKDDIKFTEDDLYARFQEIIRRSNGELTWISRETAYTCTENRPDGFGGSALFITAETMQFIATDAWLDELGDSQTKSILWKGVYPRQLEEMFFVVNHLMNYIGLKICLHGTTQNPIPNPWMSRVASIKSNPITCPRLSEHLKISLILPCSRSPSHFNDFIKREQYHTLSPTFRFINSSVLSSLTSLSFILVSLSEIRLFTVV